MKRSEEGVGLRTLNIDFKETRLRWFGHVNVGMRIAYLGEQWC